MVENNILIPFDKISYFTDEDLEEKLKGVFLSLKKVLDEKFKGDNIVKIMKGNKIIHHSFSALVDYVNRIIIKYDSTLEKKYNALEDYTPKNDLVALKALFFDYI